MSLRDIERLKALLVAISEIPQFGIDGYLVSMIFIIATVGLAKIILKTCAKQTFKYSNILTFCTIGLILSIVLKIFKFNLSQEYLEVILCLIINIIIFIIFKYRKKFKNIQS